MSDETTMAGEIRLQSDAIAEYLRETEKRAGPISDRVVAAVDGEYDRQFENGKARP
jgi:hypothetical protein